MSSFAPLKAASLKPTTPQAKAKPRAPLQKRSSLGALGVHAKLEISQPHDTLEREADTVADRVMRMPAAAPRPVTSNQSTLMRNPLIQRRCAECEEELSTAVATAPTAKGALRVSPFSGPVNKLETRLPPPPPIERNLALACRTGGQPMPAALMTFMEPRFGTDFGAVRLHHDALADTLSRSLSAKAFTVGNDVFFRRGEFQPQTSSGQRLIAHELTHVVQQGAVSPARRDDVVQHTRPPIPEVQPSHGPAQDIVQLFPGDGMMPPGDCSWAKYLALRGSVETAKAIVSTLGRCHPGDSCLLLATKIAATTAEIAARVALMTQCFRGGDRDHRDQVDQKVNMMNRCYRFFSASGCSPELIARMAAVVEAARAAVAAVAFVTAVALLVVLVLAIIALVKAIAAAAAVAGAAVATGAAAVAAVLALVLGELRSEEPPEA